MLNANKFEINVNVKKMLFFLNHQSGFISKNAISPILLNTYIESLNENCCKMIVTDLTSVIYQDIDCEVISHGKLTFPSKIMCDILKRMKSDETINIKRKANKIIVSLEKSKYELPIIEANKFPLPASNVELESLNKINRKDLFSIIERTFSFICNSETKYVLNSLHFHTLEKGGKKYLRAVATDGCRLGISEVKFDFKEEIKANIAKKTVQELKGMLMDSETEQVEFSFTENECMFVIDNSVIRSKLVSGNFPNYQSVIPKNNDKIIDLNIQDLKEVLLKVSVISPEKKIIMQISKSNELIILAKDQDVHAQSTLSMSIYSDNSEVNHDEEKTVKKTSQKDLNGIEIGLNAQYILDIISIKSDSENILFYFNSREPANPISVKQDISADYILMPMRV